MIKLKLRGPYGVDGDEDDEGTVHFNDQIWTPFGWLGKLKTHSVGNELVIDQADEIVLVRMNFGTDWSGLGLSVFTNSFGYQVFKVNARNGEVRYQLHDDVLLWEDGSEVARQQLATRLFKKWNPEGPPPPRTRSEVITKKIGTMSIAPPQIYGDPS